MSNATDPQAPVRVDREFRAANWHGRIDSEEQGFALRWHQCVRPVTAAAAAPSVSLIGFCSDAGVRRNHGRPGAAEGPLALRSVLGNFAVSRPLTFGDAGDIITDGDALESAQQRFAEAVAQLLAREQRPIGLGGGHEIALASFQGLAQHLRTRHSDAAADSAAPRVGVLNFDAHFDLRAGERATSGTPFRQIAEYCRALAWPFHYACFGVSRFANTAALFERARALDTVAVLDEEMGRAGLDDTRATLRGFLGGIDHLYMTICLDVLPPDIAPGVSAPAARGVALEVLEPLIDVAVASGKLRIADIAELSPPFDIDNRTARVAARLVARIAEAWAP